MRLDGWQKTAVALAAMLVLISSAQLDETISAVSFWWRLSREKGEFVVAHWWTHYTIASALFAPVWLVLIAGVLVFVRRKPWLAVIALSTLLIIEPISCASAPTTGIEHDEIFGLEELPYAEAERAADREHLMRIDNRLESFAAGQGRFPVSVESLKMAVADLAFEKSPYMRQGRQIKFDLRFVMNQGTPYSGQSEKPGIVYYAVNPSGTQFVLTVSGLNTPISDQPSMMKEGTFVGGKQPWGGLLAIEGTLPQK